MFVTVGGSDDLIEVILGPHGLISGPSVPAIVVDCSTVSVDASQQVREQLAGRGSALLAAPVMGNARVAEAGLADPGRIRPGADVPAGPALPGSTRHGRDIRGRGRNPRIVKLCHNLLLGVVAQTLAEVTILAQQYGVSRHALLECLNNSVMGSMFSPVQDARPGQPGLPSDLHRQPAAQGLRPRPGRGPRAGGPAASRRGGSPARAGPGGPRPRRRRLRHAAADAGRVGLA